jgi:hypothetical protein
MNNGLCENSILNVNVPTQNTYKNLLSEYNINFNAFTKSIANYNYLFEITKCCSYKEIACVYKDGTLEDIYNVVCSQFQLDKLNEKIKLYLFDGDNKILLERTDQTITSFIKMKREYFKPIYPVPASIIYKIYIDYGCCHSHDPNTVNNCKIHIDE